jgi:hypothetical protein
VLTRNLSDFARLGVPAGDPFVEMPADIEGGEQADLRSGFAPSF